MKSRNSARKQRQRASHASVWVPLAGLLVSTLAAYWNSFRVPFVFDDLQTIQRNASVRFGELGLGGTRAILFKTFVLNSLWSGQEVWSYHVVNFVLHFLNGLLVYAAARHIFRLSDMNAERGRLYAALAAALFLLHPVQTESVTYISSRSELLSTFFYLAGFLVFALWPQNRVGFLCSLAVATLYFLGMGSKETAVTLPAAIFLYDFLFVSKAAIRPVLSKWRFYLIYVLGASAAVYFLLTVELKDSVGSHLPGNLSSWQYFLTQTRVIVRYIRLVFFPVDLNLDYDFRPSSSLFEPAVLFSALFLLSVLLLGWFLRRSAPVFAFSILWFFVTLSPTSSFVPIVDVIFEHRLYLPLAGVAVSFPLLVEVLLSAVGALYERPGGHRPPLQLAASCLLLGVLLIGTVARNYTWGDEVRLFSDVLAKSPLKERPYNGLAWAHYKRGEYDQAAAVMEQAVEKLPNKAADSWDTLGNMYLRQGRYDRAIALFEKETHVFNDERLATTYNNLGMAYLYIWTDLQNRKNQLSAQEFDSKKEEVLKPAAAAFSKSLEVEPDLWSALDSYINTMCWRDRSGELEREALERLKTGTGGVPQLSALYTLGKVAFNNGDYSKADSYFDRAEKVRGDVKILLFNHAYALNMLRQDDRAIGKYLEAIRVEPIFIEAHHNLGLIYMNRRQYDKAVESFTEVLRLEPNYVSAHLNLASIYAAEGKRDLARQHLSTVLTVSPGNAQAAAMVQQLGL
jgi:tetratricopeptide (TPR) repeat protein